ALVGEKKLVPYLPIRSSIAGRVVKLDRVLGQAVKAEEVLFEVHDLSQALVQAHVSERELAGEGPRLQARVRLGADPALVGEATVVRSGRALAGDGRTLSVWVKLDRSPERPLLHGQLARVTLVQGPAASGVAVPLGAVAQEGTRSFVFVRHRD